MATRWQYLEGHGAGVLDWPMDRESCQDRSLSCLHIFTEHWCLVISCLSPPCTQGSPIGVGAHPSFSLSGQIPMHTLGHSSNRSLVKLPLANPLPYLSDKVHSCRLCLPTTLNPHLDHDTYCPQTVIIPLSVSITGLWCLWGKRPGFLYLYFLSAQHGTDTMTAGIYSFFRWINSWAEFWKTKWTLLFNAFLVIFRVMPFLILISKHDFGGVLSFS